MCGLQARCPTDYVSQSLRQKTKEVGPREVALELGTGSLTKYSQGGMTASTVYLNSLFRQYEKVQAGSPEACMGVLCTPPHPIYSTMNNCGIQGEQNFQLSLHGCCYPGCPGREYYKRVHREE